MVIGGRPRGRAHDAERPDGKDAEGALGHVHRRRRHRRGQRAARLDGGARPLPKMGLRVMFIEPGRSPGCDIDDRRLCPFYEKCARARHDRCFRRRRVRGAARASTTRIRAIIEPGRGGFSESAHTSPGHACYPYVREAIIVAARHPNIWLSPDMYLIQMGIGRLGEVGERQLLRLSGPVSVRHRLSRRFRSSLSWTNSGSCR